MTPDTLRDFRRLYNLSTREAALICGAQSRANAADTWQKWERGAYEIPPHVETIVTLCMEFPGAFDHARALAERRGGLVASPNPTARSAIRIQGNHTYDNP